MGDCYLLASLAALAQQPERLKSLFGEKHVTEDGHWVNHGLPAMWGTEIKKCSDWLFFFFGWVGGNKSSPKLVAVYGISFIGFSDNYFVFRSFRFASRRKMLHLKVLPSKYGGGSFETFLKPRVGCLGQRRQISASKASTQ